MPNPEAEPREKRAQDPVSAVLRGLLDELGGAPERDLREAWLSGLREGALVGRFELLRELGRGGFGVVYEARDRELGRLVAFKAVRPGNRSVSEMREQWLQREAEAAAQLHHPNIVTLHDAGRSEHGPYLIFELLEGETLANRLARGPLPVREAVAVAAQVARGLAHAHAVGVVHRDLKPSNVFLAEDGGVKVLDFGLAHVFGASGSQGGGTPVYMAPEQWRQEPDDERVDVFALGTMLFQSIAGEAPFRLVNDRSTALDPGPAPRLDRPDVPEPLADLVAAMLSKDPAGRPRTGQAVLARLAEVEAALGAADSRPPAPPLEPRRWWRRRATRWAAAAVAVAIAAMVAWMLVSRKPAERPVVVVTDFANETGEQELEGLSRMLITSLEQSPRLVVLTRARMMEVARQIAGAAPARIDEALGREIARRSHAAAVATGMVRRFGSVYVIDAQVMQPSGSEFLLAAREQGAHKEEVPAMLDRLSERMRSGLHERASEIRTTHVELARAATSNLEAWRHFVHGEELFELQQASEEPAYAAARVEYRRAAELAPDFVAANYRIAWTLAYEGLDAREPLARALAHLDRSPPKERLYVKALQARVENRPRDAVQLYREILDEYPGESEAWFQLAQLYQSPSMDDYPHVLEYARKALELSPDDAPAWELVLYSLFALGHDDGLLEGAQDYAGKVTSVSALEHLGYAQIVAGRAAEAEKTFDHMAQVMAGASAGLLGLGMCRLQALDLPGAEQAYRRLAAAADPRLAREGWYGLSWTSGFRGRYREALDRLDRVIEIDGRLRDAPDLTRAWGQKALWRTLGRGALSERDIRQGLTAVDPRVEPFLVYRHFYWFAIYAALLSNRLDRALELDARGKALGGNHTDVVLEVARARAQGRRDQALAVASRRHSRRELSLGLPLYLGEWDLAEGRAPEAVEQADELLSMPLFPPHPDVAGFRAAIWPRALLLRARAHEAAGDDAAARADVKRLLDLWRDADRDAPDVVRARAMWARLRSPR